jgi:putative transposase
VGTLRILGELKKLDLSMCKWTVDKYRLRQIGPPSPTWKSFKNNEARATAGWTAQQIVEAFPWDTAPKYLLGDNDCLYGYEFIERVKGLGIKEVKTALRSPRQNPFVESLIGSILRDCLDHVIVLNQRHVDGILKSYF